jgi:hypothetical protein
LSDSLQPITPCSPSRTSAGTRSPPAAVYRSLTAARAVIPEPRAIPPKTSETAVTTLSTARIEAYRVPEDARIGTLPRHFGMHMLTVESRVYEFMSQFASTYNGGMWQFFELSNGGLYMSPPGEEFELRVDSNGFQGRISADAAGIAVCLFAFSHLSFEYTTDIFSRHFHWLRNYAMDHPEASAIFAAID